MQLNEDTLKIVVPGWAQKGLWVGRCFIPQKQAYKGVEGPHVVSVKDGKVYDLSEYFDSTSQLINSENPAQFIKERTDLPEVGNLNDILLNSLYYQKNNEEVFFLPPNDIQAIKACGVTFIQSLLERVIEEKASGDPKKANDIRGIITQSIGADLKDVKPGSKKATELKKALIEAGIWSQYLEVGIGKDAEIFTKGQPLSAIGFGAELGILEDSTWNNPEPEVVLIVSSKGEILGASLGNDVNLRDYEGRSALLLGEAKDQNGSCVIGPLFRLFDESFTLEALKNEQIFLNIEGTDGFVLQDDSPMDKISRSPEALVRQAIGENHQYPDGLVLFCGTMFAPVKDRGEKGKGFTHKIGDKVTIYSKHLGALINWVNHCHEIPKWEFGISAFVSFITNRKSV